MNKKVWPQNHSPEEIRDIIAQGDVSKSSGFEGWKEAGLAEILIRTKSSKEKANRIIVRISIAILIVSVFGLLASIIFGILK